MSSYTYWFLVLSAKILTCRGLLSEELQNRHAYLLAVIATRLGEDKVCDYLCLTALIYASIISKSPAMRSSPFGGYFFRAVTSHRDRFEGDLSSQRSKLRRAIRANEVAWRNIDRALKALGPSDTLVPTPFLVLKTGIPHWVREGNQVDDLWVVVNQLDCQLNVCLTRSCSRTKWWYIYSHSWRRLVAAHTSGRDQFLWIWEKLWQQRSSGSVRYHHWFTTLYIRFATCTFPSILYVLGNLHIHCYDCGAPLAAQGREQSKEESKSAR